MNIAPAFHSHSYDTGLLERLLFRAAKKWVAGYNQADAIEAARGSNAQDIEVILNFLGEDSVDLEVIKATVNEYDTLIDRMYKERINGCISIKPTQFGLALDYNLCMTNYKFIVSRANRLGRFVWIDMESAKFVDSTIALYLELIREYDGMVGIALQSYLRRSADDLVLLLQKGAIVRLVKGAYHEHEQIAFSSRGEIDQNYSMLMQILFEGKNRFAIATHDSNLVAEAIAFAAKDSESNHARFEFQMLMGIRDELKRELVTRGFRVSEYIPYGTHWLPYSVRRLREHKRSILLLARSLF